MRVVVNSMSFWNHEVSQAFEAGLIGAEAHDALHEFWQAAKACIRERDYNNAQSVMNQAWAYLTREVRQSVQGLLNAEGGVQ